MCFDIFILEENRNWTQTQSIKKLAHTYILMYLRLKSDLEALIRQDVFISSQTKTERRDSSQANGIK